MTPEKLRLLEANYQKSQQREQAQRQAKPKGRGGILTSLISEGGGFGGALAGGAAGAAIGSAVPVIGTTIGGILGAGIGGFVGGTGGSVAEQKIRDDQVNMGKALREGAIEGVLSAGPIKGVKAVGQLGKAVAKQGVEEAAEGVVKAGLRRSSTSLLGDAWGIRTGAKVAGKELVPQEARALQKFVMEEVGVPRTANATRVAERLSEFKTTIGRNIGDNIAAINRPFKRTESKGLIDAFSGKVGKIAGQSADDPLVSTIGGQVRSIGSIGELVDFRRSLDDQINFVRNAASPDPVKEQVYRAARETIDDFTSKLSPELKRQNKLFSRADRALDATLSAARSPRGVQVPGMLGRVGGGTAQRVRSTAGQLISGAERAAKPLTQIGPAGQALRTGIAGGINASLNAPTVQDGTLEQPQDMMDTSQLDALSGLEDMQSANPYPRENLLYDIQRDPKNADDYIKQYAAFQEIFGAPEAKPLSGEAQKRALTAESGLRSLGTLEDTLSRDPGAFQRQALPNPLGITGRLTGTTDIRAATDNVVDVIARLRSGAAITDEEAARFARLLPQPGDSRSSAASKLQMVRAELESFMRPSGGNSLEDMLMQRGGY